MRIFGIGIDIVETARIEDSIERFEDRFLNRVFAESEQEYCRKMKFPARHYAARFAAKEAIAKAFGTGIGANLGWDDMEILRNAEGQPYVILSGDGQAFADANGITSVQISISHADHYAAANAMAICD
ncbi:MAG: holo-ACP synthase [Verrucomicrobiales bacterium]|nr:holo-ACP synthase [Verrucomicrobiales bacterium]